MKYNAKFLQERYAKDEDFYVQVNDVYIPDYRTTAVSSKFYSAAEALDLTTADPEILRLTKLAKDMGPKEKFPWPATENQWYGWFEKPLVDQHRDDQRFCFAHNSCDIVTHGLKIKLDKAMALTGSGGRQFKL